MPRSSYEAPSTTDVSVVVPVFNVEPFLSRCIESLLNQDFTDFEVILVDDGSTDGCPRICDAFAALDPRIRVVHQLNRGLSGARNTGLAAAGGEYVCFLDGDDWADSTMISSLVEAAQTHAADIVVAGFHLDTVDASEALTHTLRVRPSLELVGPGRGCQQASTTTINLLGYAWNKLYRKSLITDRGIRFTEGLSLIEDAVFNGVACRESARVLLLDQAHVHYMQRPRTTLVNRYYDDFVQMRFRAIAEMSSVLTHWGVPTSTVQAITTQLRLEAVYAAITSIPVKASSSRARLSAIKAILRDADVRSTFDSAGRAGGIPARYRGFALLLSAAPAWAVAPILTSRRNTRRGRSNDGGGRE